MDEVKTAIAFLFKRKGRDEMMERDFVMSASMDLGWFPPRDAQHLLQIGLDSKLLEVIDGKLKPTFNVSIIEIPLDYMPPPNLLKIDVTSSGLFNKIIDKILATTNLDKKQLISIINSIQDELDVEIEVAALIVGRDIGVDVSDFIEEIEKEIMTRLR